MNSLKKIHPVILHLAFWVSYVLIQAVIYMDLYEMENVQMSPDGKETVTRVTFPETFRISFTDTLIELPGKIIFTYINLYFLLEFYILRKKKLWLYAGTLIFAYVFADAIQRLLVIYVFFPNFRPELDPQKILTLSAHLQYAAGCFSVLVFTSSIKLLIHYFQEKEKSNVIERQKLDTELKYLKTQINPHFFFNTLNSLYGLALNKSESTPNAIIQLSNIMDYLLYGSEEKEVSITKELQVLENYIALEKRRYDKRVNITFYKAGDFDNAVIAPLLLLPLLENAFKHGVQLQEDDTTEILIKAKVDKKVFEFFIENTIPDSKGRKLKPSGIGLENLKRRIELLYGKKCEFGVRSENRVFAVNIVIKLE